MISGRLETRLSEVEALLDDMATLLVRGDASAFEASATALRRSMAELAHTSAEEPRHNLALPAIRARLARVSHALVRQRDNLARCAVVNERSLATVLPQRQPTYTRPGRSDPFRGSVARIYKS